MKSQYYSNAKGNTQLTVDCEGAFTYESDCRDSLAWTSYMTGEVSASTPHAVVQGHTRRA